MSDAEFSEADRLADLRARYLSVTNAAAQAARAAVADLAGDRGAAAEMRQSMRRRAARQRAASSSMN